MLYASSLGILDGSSLNLAGGHASVSSRSSVPRKICVEARHLDPSDRPADSFVAVGSMGGKTSGRSNARSYVVDRSKLMIIDFLLLESLKSQLQDSAS